MKDAATLDAMLFEVRRRYNTEGKGVSTFTGGGEGSSEMGSCDNGRGHT